jgi:2-(1,2-epoxy-1,2-dihydrophenyl)acetyl-CoA isomerase
MTTTSPDAGTVLAQSHGAVTVLTLSYAARRNALSMPLRAALHTQLEQAMADPECRAVVLTGEGGHFCSGGDISSFGGVTPASGRARMQRVHAIVRLLVRGEKPVIAAVEGHAAGAGLCIAAACDVVVASREAKLSCTFNKIGLFPDLGGAWSIPLRMGLGRAKLLMMTGRVMDAATAAQQGLVDQLAEPGQALADALAMAQEMAPCRRCPTACSSRCWRAGRCRWKPAGRRDRRAGRALRQRRLPRRPEAFLAKRKPVFKGR